MTHARSLSRSVVVGVTLALLGGCVSALPSPINNIEPLAGNWSGTVNVGGSLLPFYLTIYLDHRLVATWGLVWNSGTITIASGQARYQMSPPLREGTLRLYLDAGKPTLFMDDLWLSFQAVVTRLPTGPI
jgi:hypothetical protein